jgi:Domain of unknown function (DUF2341)/Protein of unknown function (DUF1565)
MTDFFVSETGNDSNVGTIALPFKTIQKAAMLAKAGDIVKIRKGIFRETVSPVNNGTATSPIIFESYQNEVVTISGCDVLINPWKDLGSGIFETTLPMGSLGLGRDQLFVDSEIYVSSRYPFLRNETTQTRSQQLLSTGGSATNNNGVGLGTLSHPDLALFPSGYWVGGRVNYAGMSGEVWQTGKITEHNGDQITFTFTWFNNGYIPSKDTVFYLWNKSPQNFNNGEYFIEGNQLKVKTFGGINPTTLTVEMKNREWAFNLAGKSHIIIRNLRIGGSSINTIQNNAHSLNAGTGIIIDNVDAKYISHYRVLEGNPYIDGTIDTGFNIKGSGNEVRNCRIQFSAGNGISLGGNNNKVINNLILDTNYAGSDSGGIFTDTVFSPNTGHVIEHNSVVGCGRSAIVLRRCNAGKCQYNQVESYGRMCNDFGGIYTWNTDGKNQEIAYNVVKVASGKLSVGIYLDNNTINHVVHHNLVIGTGIQLNGPNSSGNRIINNTVDGWIGYGVVSNSTGSELKNNIIFDKINNLPSGIASNNLTQFDEPSIINREQENYQLRSSSIAINSGTILAPYTNGFTGTNPDIGCWERDINSWIGGVKLQASEIPLLSVETSVVKLGKVTVKINLPIHKKLPMFTQIKIGNNAALGNPTYQGNQAIFKEVGAIGNRPATGSTVVPISISLDRVNWVQISSINLAPTSVKSYKVQATLTGVTSNIALITLNTKAIIAAGKMRSDGGDLRIFDSNNLPVPFYIDGGINTEKTLIFVRFPSIPVGGKATVNLIYGNKLLESESDLGAVFPSLALSNNKCWLAANDGVTCRGDSQSPGQIIKVRDRACNLTSPTTYHSDWNKPVIVPNPTLGVDSKGIPVFRFTGKEGLDVPNLRIGNNRDRTIFAVQRYYQEDWEASLYGTGYGANTDLGRFINAKPIPQDRLTLKQLNGTMSVRSTPDGSLPRDRINLISIISNSSGTQVFIQGVQQLVTTDKIHNYQIDSEFYLGRKRADESSRWYKGDIYEFIVFNSALDNANRTAIESYLSLKYLSQNSVSFFPEITI